MGVRNVSYQLMAREDNSQKIVRVSDIVGGFDTSVMDPSQYLEQEKTAIYFECRKHGLRRPVLALVDCGLPVSFMSNGDGGSIA